MNKTTLAASAVTGFFSLPSPSLAEHNPDAYNNAMADAPAGAGTCAYCGTGIRHHVVIQTPEGDVRFIGTDCAAKIGGEVALCVGARQTTTQRAERQAYYAQINAQRAEEERQHEIRKAEREEKFADVLRALRAQQTQFHNSLASQLVEGGSLSWKQSNYALKALFGRRNKKNAAAYDATANAIEGIE